MPFLIPFAVGAASTGYAWWNSGSEVEEPTATEKATEVLLPLLAWLVLLFIIYRATKKS